MLQEKREIIYRAFRFVVIIDHKGESIAEVGRHQVGTELALRCLTELSMLFQGWKMMSFLYHSLVVPF